ncbi:acyltransferase [Mesorhizobium sp. M1295]|uniref:acyltransferase family protein n=1 Tax=Mesorhizobium sp. M1295 TaxID=2957076 RepID=UPI00333D37DE
MASTPNFIPALSGIRAVAAITVVLSHATSSGFLPKSFLDGAASTGVMLFFSLSGFLMAYLYLWKPASLGSILEYSAARVGRVYPLFAVVILFSCAMHYVDNRFAYNLDLMYAIQHLLLFGNTNTIWTIASEFYFYGLFIPIWIWCSSSRSKTTFRLVAFAVFLILCLWFLGFPGGRIAITRYLHFFLLGMVAAAAHRHIRSTSFANWALPGSLVVYVLTLPDILYWAFGLQHPGYESVFPAILMSSIVFFAAQANQTSTVAWVLGTRPMVYLGELSFGLYLLHRPAMSIWKGMLAHTGWDPPLPIPFICLVIGLWLVSHLANRFIEVPARQFIKERSTIERSPLAPSLVDAGPDQEAARP